MKANYDTVLMRIINESWFNCTYLEQWRNVNIEAEISKACCDDLLAAIMPILTHLCVGEENIAIVYFIGIDKQLHCG